MEKRSWERLFVTIASLFVWVYVFAYQLLCIHLLGLDDSGLRAALGVLWACALSGLTAFVGWGIIGESRILTCVYRHRVALAGAVFVLLVALNLNGSSIGCWDGYLTDVHRDGYLLGYPLKIRSDEWAVWTPMAISQASVGYPSVSPLLSGGPAATEWVSVGGLPAWGPAAAFKPLYWGFFLFGFERGFSFLWNGRWILLFLVTFEAFTRLARGSGRLGLMAAVLVSFAPVVQWFFSQSIAEVIFFSEGVVLCLDRFLRKGPVRQRMLWAAASAYLLGCLVMVGYPAWLVPQMYLILTFAVILLVRRRQALDRAGALALCASLAAVTLCVGAVVLRTSDTLRMVLQSVYPGSRLITGGTGFDGPYRSGFAQLFYPFADRLNAFDASNPCELAGFIDLFPAGFVLSAIALLRVRKKDPVLMGVMALGAALGLFVVVGFPQALAKASLLHNTPVGRMTVVFGVINIVLLVRALAILDRLHPLAAAVCAVSCIAFSVCTGQSELCEKYGLVKLFCLGCPILLFGLLFFYACKRTPAALGLAVLVTSALVFSAGVVVNPVQRGFDVLNRSQILRRLKAIPAAEDDLWLAEGTEGNLLLLAGKPALNSTQEYADGSRWAPVDPSGEYRDVYNRFCHIAAFVVEQPTTFSLVTPDNIRLALNVDDLEKLGVTHLLTTHVYPQQLGAVRFHLIDKIGDFQIYACIYDAPDTPPDESAVPLKCSGHGIQMGLPRLSMRQPGYVCSAW